MNLTHFVGIDVGKEKFTFCILEHNTKVVEAELSNNDSGVLKLIQFFRQELEIDIAQVVFCMEHTGVYSLILLHALHAAGANVSVENATRIKLSLGLTRGKSDQLDARRIAEFASRFVDKLSFWKPRSKAIQQLQHLTALRDRLIKIRTQLQVPIDEAEGFLDEEDLELIAQPSLKVLDTLSTQIEQVEHKIDRIIASDAKLKRMVKQIDSIPGVGIVTATELIIRTNEFKDFQNAKKLACHVGIAPFEHSSGTSMRGRTKVSHKAHKRLKTLLHLCSMAAIKSDNEFRRYYQLKISQGKNKMSIINAIRNKILHRAFAIILNDTIYHENYQYKFA